MWAAFLTRKSYKVAPISFPHTCKRSLYFHYDVAIGVSSECPLKRGSNDKAWPAAGEDHCFGHMSQEPDDIWQLLDVHKERRASI